MFKATLRQVVSRATVRVSPIVFFYIFSCLQFNKGNQKHNSTHRTDFRNFSGHRPDVLVRRQALQKNLGLGPEHIFYHHGKRYENNNVSWYDEMYNGRWEENKDLPGLRDWNSHKLSWAPERSDYPLQGRLLNFL